jgi:hypothetical protein
MKNPSRIISNLIVPLIVSLLFGLQVLALVSVRSRSLCLEALPWNSGPGNGARVSIVPPAQQPKPVVTDTKKGNIQMKNPFSIISNLILPLIVSLLSALQLLSLLGLRSRSLCLEVLPWNSGPGDGARVSIVPPAQQPPSGSAICV